MASLRTYTCFVCQKAGHEVPVFLDGKDEQGHTKYLNEDMTRHTHLGSGSQQQQQRQGKQLQSEHNRQGTLQQVSDESVDRGISAFTMMSDLIKLVEQTQKQLVTANEKLDRMLNPAERK